MNDRKKQHKRWKHKPIKGKALLKLDYGTRKDNYKGPVGSQFKGINSYGVKPEPFPRVLLTQAKYSAEGQMAVSSGLPFANAITFRANSIWDPYYATSPGQTVCGHAQLASIYSSYLVLGAKVILSFTDPQNTDDIRCGYRLRIGGGGGASTSTFQSLTETPMTYMSGIANTGSQKKSFHFYVRPWQLHGVSKLEYLANSSLFTSGISANPPADNCLFDIIAISPRGETGNVRYTITIKYYIKLFNRKYLVSSSS